MNQPADCVTVNQRHFLWWLLTLPVKCWAAILLSTILPFPVWCVPVVAVALLWQCAWPVYERTRCS